MKRIDVFLCARAITLLIPLVLLSPFAGPAARAADTNVYRIELLVFRNIGAQDGGELFRPGVADTLETATDTRNVEWLGPDAYQLGGIAAAMHRSRRYAPLLHLAWEERVAGRSDARPVALPDSRARAGGDYVTGTARVGLGRYLHLDLDLTLHESDVRFTSAGGTPVETAPEYRLQESRRMRSKELHYFDHPLFGVLAIITPVD